MFRLAVDDLGLPGGGASPGEGTGEEGVLGASLGLPGTRLDRARIGGFLGGDE